jgi:ubiquinone/menaquinone biosynthesis C-methylase UbiE
MSMSESPKPEKASTYIVQNRNDERELTRLTIQDDMVTREMGGVLPEQSDLTDIHRILDVACGTGGWLIDVAKTYPQMKVLEGIDISKRMIEYARSRAEMAQVSDRVNFRIMDALQMLEYPENYFDMVNMRFSIGFIRTWEWGKMLTEMQHVTRPDGIIRVTEGNISTSNSAALTQLYAMFSCAFEKAGHLFTPEQTTMGDNLPRIFKQYGLHQVQTRAYDIEYLAGTPTGQAYCEDMTHMFKTAQPFIQKWGCAGKDYETIYQQTLSDMQRPDFHATWQVVTIWGHVSESK